VAALILYAITALFVLWLCHRAVLPLSRAAVLALFFLPFCLTGLALITGRVYAPIDLTYGQPPLLGLAPEMGIDGWRNVLLSDLIAQMIPWRGVVQWSWANGQWPLWNPFSLSGDLLAASAQPAAYSPVTLLACLVPVAQGLTFSAAITFFIAGAGAFLLCRHIGCRELVAVIAAAAWMYSTAITFFILWPLGASWALLPSLLLAVRHVVRLPGLGSFALLTTVFVLLITAGHPESTLHVVAVGLAYGVFELVRASGLRWRGIATAGAAGAAALLACAIYILPLLEAMPQTREYVHRSLAPPQAGVSTATSIARLVSNFFPSLHIARWHTPAVSSVSPDIAVVGSLTLAAAIFGLWRVRSAQTWFFGALLLFSLIAQAQPPWFTAVTRRLPLFDLALNERFSFAAALCLVVLAALGLEHVADKPRAIGLAVTCLITLVVLAVGTLMITRSDLVSIQGFPWGRYKIPAELVALGAAAALFFLPMRRYSLIVFLALLVAQRVISEGGVYPTVPARAAYPPVPLFAPIDRQQPFRIVGLRDVLTPATGAMYELQDVRGYNPMAFARYTALYPLWCIQFGAWFNRVDDLMVPFLSFLNVRYAVTQTADAIPPGWREVAADRGARLLENANMLPRAFVPLRVRVGGTQEQTISEMAAAGDFRSVAWIEAASPRHERPNGPGSINILRAGPPYELDVDMKDEGWIVVSDNAWRGWRAYIDGQPAPTSIANVAFVSVRVPRGHHRVRLIYRPASFVVGRVVTFASLFGFAVIAIVAIRRKSAAL
jgi:hypothetical protein